MIFLSPLSLFLGLTFIDKLKVFYETILEEKNAFMIYRYPIGDKHFIEKNSQQGTLRIASTALGGLSQENRQVLTHHAAFERLIGCIDHLFQERKFDTREGAKKFYEVYKMSPPEAASQFRRLEAYPHLQAKIFERLLNATEYSSQERLCVVLNLAGDNVYTKRLLNELYEISFSTHFLDIRPFFKTLWKDLEKISDTQLIECFLEFLEAPHFIHWVSTHLTLIHKKPYLALESITNFLEKCTACQKETSIHFHQCILQMLEGCYDSLHYVRTYDPTFAANMRPEEGVQKVFESALNCLFILPIKNQKEILMCLSAHTFEKIFYLIYNFVFMDQENQQKEKKKNCVSVIQLELAANLLDRCLEDADLLKRILSLLKEKDDFCGARMCHDLVTQIKVCSLISKKERKEKAREFMTLVPSQFQAKFLKKKKRV